MSALSDWRQRIMFATTNLGSLICCKLLQIEVTFELYLGNVRFSWGGGRAGNFGIFSQKSVGPPLRFNKNTPDPPPLGD